MTKGPLVKFRHAGRRVAVNRGAVLYLYEVDADRCAIVVGNIGGDERVVAVDGTLDEVTDELGSDDEKDAGAASLLRFHKEWSLEAGPSNDPHVIWERCDYLKSPDPEDIRKIWSFFIVRPDLATDLAGVLCARYSAIDLRRLQKLTKILFLLELLLITRRYEACSEIGDLLALRFGSDLRLADIRARAIILKAQANAREIDLDFAIAPFRQRFCPSTFDTLAFFESDVFICCCNYLPTSIGSIRSSSQSELWDGEVAKNVRRTILDGSFQYCNKMVCPRLRNGDLPERDSPALAPYYQRIITHAAVSTPLCYPRTVELNEDPACNLTCASCRKDVIFGEKPFLAKFERTVLAETLSFPLNSLLIACYGEPFASKHYLRVLRALDTTKHKIDTLVIYTNGILLTQEMWQSLSNLHGFRIEMRVSIDAATKESYERIRRRGKWQTLQENLLLISDLRRRKIVSKLVFAFVVQADNFLEMESFVEMAKLNGADEVFFAEMQKYGEYISNDLLYEEKAVHLGMHPDHAQLAYILGQPFMADPIVSLHGCRVELMQTRTRHSEAPSLAATRH